MPVSNRRETKPPLATPTVAVARGGVYKERGSRDRRKRTLRDQTGNLEQARFIQALPTKTQFYSKGRCLESTTERRANIVIMMTLQAIPRLNVVSNITVPVVPLYAGAKVPRNNSRWLYIPHG